MAKNTNNVDASAGSMSDRADIVPPKYRVMIVTGLVTAFFTFYLWPFPLGFKQFNPPLWGVLAGFLAGCGIARAYFAIMKSDKTNSI